MPTQPLSRPEIALITGSSRGLGLEVAKLLAAKGVCTVLTGRSQSQLDESLRDLPGENHMGIVVDFFESLGNPFVVLVGQNLAGNVEEDAFFLINMRSEYFE